MAYSPLLQDLLEALRCLPGVGPRTAQRMAFQLLDGERDRGRRLVSAMQQAIDTISECSRCRMLAEAELCWICEAPRRDRSIVCIVESPADVIAIEESASYNGCYFVLMGRLSPLDGIGPDELNLDLLESQLDGGEIEEIIIATSATVEGEATAGYLANLARNRGVCATRIAHGVPLGGELEFVDSNTLSLAISGRLNLSDES
jgi:recombination protein RecR